MSSYTAAYFTCITTIFHLTLQLIPPCICVFSKSPGIVESSLVPISSSPTSQSYALQTHTPQTPFIQSSASYTHNPQSPTLQTPTPQSLTPQKLTPQSPTSGTPTSPGWRGRKGGSYVLSAMMKFE